MPNAGALAATARPIRPRPMMPSCLPRSSVPSMKSSAQPSPLAAANQPIAFGDAPRERQNQRPGQLGRRLGQHVRRVGEHHAARLHGGHIDVVVAHRDVRDDLQIRKPASTTAPSIRSVSRQMSPCFALHPRFQLIGSQRTRAVVQIDVARGFETREGGGWNPAGQEDWTASSRIAQSTHQAMRNSI